jgi:hypothetical protein
MCTHYARRSARHRISPPRRRSRPSRLAHTRTVWTGTPAFSHSRWAPFVVDGSRSDMRPPTIRARPEGLYANHPQLGVIKHLALTYHEAAPGDRLHSRSDLLSNEFRRALNSLWSSTVFTPSTPPRASTVSHLGLPSSHTHLSHKLRPHPAYGPRRERCEDCTSVYAIAPLHSA